MNVAFLFNSDHESLCGEYGSPVMRKILGAGVLQTSARTLRVSVGDILTYSAATQSATPKKEYLMEICKATYTPVHLDFLLRQRLRATFGRATVYCWLFQSMTSGQAQCMHMRLKDDAFYLGAMDVLFSNPVQLALFRNSLIERYKFRLSTCAAFGENSRLSTCRRRRTF